MDESWATLAYQDVQKIPQFRVLCNGIFTHSAVGYIKDLSGWFANSQATKEFLNAFKAFAGKP